MLANFILKQIVSKLLISSNFIRRQQKDEKQAEHWIFSHIFEKKVTKLQRLLASNQNNSVE